MTYNELQYKKINDMLNMKEQIIVCLGGIPGSGKSTIAKQFEEAGFVVICKDRIRVACAKEQYSGEYYSEFDDKVLQSYNKRIPAISRKLADEAIAAGKSIIFDACYLSERARRQMFAMTHKLPVYSIFLDCSVEFAKKRNYHRSTTIIASKNGKNIYGHSVPDCNIEEMAKAVKFPDVKEGFKEVAIVHLHDEEVKLESAKEKLLSLYDMSYDEVNDTLHDWKKNDMFRVILPSMLFCMDYNQNNKNHSFLLHEHMMKAAFYVKEHDDKIPTNINKRLLFLAMLIHDIGKPATVQNFARLKVNTDIFKEQEKIVVLREGENKLVQCVKLDHNGFRQQLLSTAYLDIDKNSHYYNHQIIGAQIARRELSEIGFTEDELNFVYDCIFYHMSLPFNQKLTHRSMKKIILSLGKENIGLYSLIREADMSASNSRDYENWNANIQLLHEVMEEV